MELIAILLVLFLFLALCALFSGIETGLISIDQLKLEKEARTNKFRAQLLSFIRQPDKVLGTTLIGYNIVNVILASVSTYLVQSIALRYPQRIFDPHYTSLAVGSIVLVFGEIIPKAMFRDFPETLVPKLFPVLRFFYFILKPLVSAVTWINNQLQKLFYIGGERGMMYLTKDDLAFLLTQGEVTPETEPHRDMIEDALEFNEQQAWNVMVPRTEVVALEEKMSVEEILEVARREGFTRYPVYRENLDNILGVLIIYDIIRRRDEKNLTAGKLIHEPLFVPENMDLDILLKEMQLHRKSMAIIVDSYGGTEGIVTIEDILEEVVGEIEDEYDVDEDKEVEQVGPQTWLVKADVEIDRLIDEHGIELPKGDYETLAGLILDKLARIPRQGQRLDIGFYRLQILQASEKKIIKVRIQGFSAPESSR